jgi:hypothetical protein
MGWATTKIKGIVTRDKTTFTLFGLKRMSGEEMGANQRGNFAGRIVETGNNFLKLSCFNKRLIPLNIDHSD